jgi:hypothetical protein
MMIIILSYFIIIMLGIWLLLSIMAQFRDVKIIKWINDRDPFALLPAWTFFAPNPGVTDYQLFYRDKLYDGQFTTWKKVRHRDRSIFHSIVNPDKRAQKAIADCCISILQMVKENRNNRLIQKSFPYLMIMSCIMYMPKDSESEYRQFSIVRTFGFISSKKPINEFTSSLHNFASYL